MLYMTPSQTVGPYLRIGFDWFDNGDMTRHANGELDAQSIVISGQVIDGAGAAVPDAVIEVWQPDGDGHFSASCVNRDPRTPRERFLGFGRCCTDAEGYFSFTTIKPGRIANGDMPELAAPCITVQVFMRGILTALHTRLYFGDDALDGDPILELVPTERRQTLVASVSGARTYHWDIRLQGECETVFFEL
ncbi:protocatechuate 3,4-dioxygenase subunit alpha [Paraburkholderia nemoris]|uniref:protocatechuate 3,4-dioxygenase subunit alpha n=1 Tax=Paraburkholderia nemoris TaxID=2793076 RepID=UPI0038BCCE98